ncbi:MAG TPA: CheR family methyltransferase, partial [Candidatus Limnocylindrales bacterium]|nr:CheR family methyltransferase [Candidatus Limnocylindrales bacterium]
MADRATFEDSFVVVLGASAGGIEALRRVVAGLPAAFAAPIVVAQHVAADRSSRLATILGSAGPLPVITVTGPTPLEPGHVYVAPGHEHVLVTDHRVELQSAGPGQSAPSVDRLLSTASEALGDRLIAVILTGMGSDGTAGAREVRARGGTVVIQDPETAPFPSMPKSLPPGLVDFVASPDELGPLLVQLVSGPVAPPGPRPEDDRLLRSFLDEVRERTGMDFTAYKRPTILRRLQRRVVATQTGTLRAYVRYAQSHPDEYQRLASTFLIKVTQFFRDPELYDLLRDVILPRLVEDAADRDREIRIWSAGCATGEEAYSLAILASELLAEAGEELGVRIFATDLDEDAIAFARRGIYPLSSLTGMPPDLAARYFNPLGEDAEVSKRIRGMVVFGQHDLGRRAPFPRIDLTLCRNVLIYFTPELQRRALHLFAFSLRDGGYLVLGKSESTTPLADHFVLEHARLKVYRRAGERIVVPSPRIRDAAPVGTTPRRPTPRPAWTGDPAPFTLRDPAPASERPEHLVLRLPVGIVVVDARYDITLINGAARRQLGIHGPAVGSDLVHLAHGLPSDEVRARVDDAMRGRSSELVVRLPEGAPQAPDRDEVVTLAFTPLRPSDDTAVDRVLISIVDITRPSNELRDVQVELERARADLERMRKRADTAVRATNELLQANEELTTANALLRTANEDLLVTAEEVQAATEEVETLNEEFQATNEELETLNEELQATNEELNTTNDDLEARSAELEEVAATLQEQRGRAELERGKLSLILDAMTDA